MVHDVCSFLVMFRGKGLEESSRAHIFAAMVEQSEASGGL
jgi:hypothetical protein